MKTFVGTTATNPHLHQIGRALHEAGLLSLYMMPFADLSFPRPDSIARRVLRKVSPRTDLLMRRRRPPDIPAPKILQQARWEFFRLAVAKLGFPETWSDSVWEHQEKVFDRTCARIIARGEFDIFLGLEHGALAALQVARARRVLAGLIFTSVHHRFRSRWLDPELERFPQLLDPAARKIRQRDVFRDERRDAEIASADFIHANSLTTARSLIEAGVSPDRILTVPLGAPAVRSGRELPVALPSTPVVLFVGNIAVHKGAHHLLEAWQRLGPKGAARLEFYGHMMPPASCLPPPSPDVIFHGPASPATVRAAMQRASVLVLPSLCDGFGMVVMEAMAQGLPVIASENVGAMQFIRKGENGFVVPPADPTRLAERLAWCLDHPAELHAMNEAALATARGWTWADFRADFVAKLLAIAKRQPR